LVDEFPGLARIEEIGRSREGRPLELLSVGHGKRPVLLVGTPHPNEPIGTLTIEFLTRLLCEDATVRGELDITLHAITVAAPDGLVLNEGWLKGRFSPLRYALEFYRPPHREQVEWSFPVDHRTLLFPTPSPETAAVMRVMERVRPSFFYSLHNAGFCGVYFYASHRRPALFRSLRDLVERFGLPLHRGEPEVPYVETLATAVYGLFGVRETYDYLARTLGRDPAPLIEAGTSSDDWLRGIADAFTLVCEIPYYTAPGLSDESSSGEKRRDAVNRGLERSAAVHATVDRAFREVRGRVGDDRLVRSVADYVAKTPQRLQARRVEAATPSYDREATRAEALDAAVCSVFYHGLYLGEVHRLAERAGERVLASEVHGALATLVTEIERESALRTLPLRSLVAVQAGSALLALGEPGVADG